MLLRFFICFLAALTQGQAQSTLIADDLRRMFNEEKDQEKRAGWYHQLVAEMLATDSSLALPCADTLEALSIRYPKGRAEATHIRAEYHALNGNHREALALLHRELELRKQINDTAGLARSFYELGKNFRELNITDSTLYYYNQSLDLSGLTGDFTQVAVVLSAIGQWYFEMDRLSQAIGFFQQALQSSQTHGNKTGFVYACSNLSLFYGAAGQLDSAVVYAQKGIGLALEQGDYFAAGAIAGGICQAFTQAARYYEAIPLGNQALDYFARSGRKQKMVNIYLYLAIACNQLGRPEEALDYSLPGYELLTELKLVSPLKEYYEQIAQSYERMGRSRDSLLWYKKFVFLKDSLSRTEQLKQLTALEERYQLQKAETEKVLYQFQEALDSMDRYRFFSGTLGTISALFVFGLLGMLYRTRHQKGKKPERREGQAFYD